MGRRRRSSPSRRRQRAQGESALGGVNNEEWLVLKSRRLPQLQQLWAHEKGAARSDKAGT